MIFSGLDIGRYTVDALCWFKASNTIINSNRIISVHCISHSIRVAGSNPDMAKAISSGKNVDPVTFDSIELYCDPTRENGFRRNKQINIITYLPYIKNLVNNLINLFLKAI